MNLTRDRDLCRLFGMHLKLLRVSRQLTQEALANRASVSLSQISRLERGLLNPTISTLSVLAKALEMRLIDMLDIEYLIDEYDDSV